MNTLNEVIEKKLNGMHYGGKILLPFCAHVFHALIVKKAIMEGGKDLEYTANFSYKINEDFTEICFNNYDDLYEHLSEDDAINLLVVEKGKDVFNKANHRTIILHLKDEHIVEIVE